MPRFSLNVNGTARLVEATPDTPLLWILRDQMNLTGTKYGCGIGMCGACTVHLDGGAVRSCQIKVSDVVGRLITTIEGLEQMGACRVQEAWIAEQVPQCGYCQPGQIMSAAALLVRTPKVSDEEIIEAMAGNLCRCATYCRIRKAIHRAAAKTK